MQPGTLVHIKMPGRLSCPSHKENGDIALCGEWCAIREACKGKWEKGTATGLILKRGRREVRILINGLASWIQIWELEELGEVI